MRKAMRLGVMGLLALVGLAANSSMAGLFDGWTYRADLQFAGYGRSETLTNFPALVILSEGTVPGFVASYAEFSTATNGADLRFASAGGSVELPYEIETFDARGVSYVWVQVPLLTGTNTTISVYWGKEGVSAPAYTTNGATWDEHYMGVWHMKEASSNTLADSTAHVNRSISNLLDSATGVADGGMLGGNVPAWAQVQDSASLKWTNLTVESWVQLVGMGSLNSKVIGKGSASSTEFMMWYYYPDHRMYFGVCQGSTWDTRVYAPPADLPASADWYHFVGSYDGASVRFYLNGVEVGSGTAAAMTPYNGSGPLYLGAAFATDDGQTMHGRLDEQRMSSVARSANYIYATWLNQASNSVFVKYSAVRDAVAPSAITGWPVKMKIRFAGYNRPQAPLTNFPALVILSTNIPNFHYSTFRSAQGADLRFVSSDGTLTLKHEIEKWDPNGSSLVWVKVPELADTNTFVWALWGKEGAAAPAYATNGATWDGNYMGVWHLKEASGGTLADSTAHANRSVSNFLDAVDGKVDGGMGGANDKWAQIQDSASLNWTNLTVESWVRFTHLGTSSKIISKGLYDDNSFEFTMWYYTDGNVYFGVSPSGLWGSADKTYAPTFNPSPEVWYHMVGTYDGAAVRLYVNGAEIGSGTPTSLTPYNGTGPLFLGSALVIPDPTAINGRLDEQRLSNTARGSNYIYATWLNQASNDVFVACGPVTYPSGTAIWIN